MQINIHYCWTCGDTNWENLKEKSKKILRQDYILDFLIEAKNENQSIVDDRSRHGYAIFKCNNQTQRKILKNKILEILVNGWNLI